jgi:Reverse transcriptase (RNA-dependent DNA polymerase)
VKRPPRSLLVDSGAGAMVFSDSDLFIDMRSPDGPTAVNFGKQKILPVASVGTIAFTLSRPRRRPIPICLPNVLFVPDAGPGLCIISVHGLHLQGHGANFDHPPGYVRWKTGNTDVIQKCDWIENFPFVHITPMPCSKRLNTPNVSALCCHISAPPSHLAVQHAHARFGHAGNSALSALAKLNAFPPDVVKQYKNQPCPDCKLANATRDSYPHVDGLAKLPGDVLHVDLLHFPEHTFDGKKYALMSIDESTRYVDVALLSKKSEAASHLVALMQRYKTLLNRSIKYLRSDLGGEFHSTVLKIEKQQLGVTDQHVPARCHESNGFIERTNRTFGEGVRAVLKASKMPHGFWGEVLLYVKHTYNLTPHHALIERGCEVPIPHVQFHTESRDRLARLHKQLVPFGISCFVHKVDDHPKKLADRSEAGFIVGYGPSSQLYRVVVVDPVTNVMRFRIARHVHVTAAQHSEYHSRTAPPFTLKGVPKLRNVTTCVDPLHSAVMFSVRPCKADLAVTSADSTLHYNVCTSPLPPAGVCIVPLNGSDNVLLQTRASVPLSTLKMMTTKSLGLTTIVHKPKILRNISLVDTVNGSPTHEPRGTLKDHSIPASMPGTVANNPNVGTSMGMNPTTHCAEVEDCGTHYVLSVSCDFPSVKVALSGDDAPEWLASMHDELDSIMSNDVYDLVEPPENCNIVGSKWVLKYKRNACGEIERRKSRLVAQGFSQKPGVDFHDLYSPTGHQATFRMLLLYAAKYDLEIRHVDIKCAFLQGDLHETIYMRQPPILNDGTNKVWKLKKPLYGLKQAPRQWNHKLQSELTLMGFQQATNDSALFMHRDTKAILFVWVDDLVVVSDSQHAESHVHSILEKFEGRDLGEASWILGLEVLRDRSKRTITITQRRMTQTVLERFDTWSKVRVVSTPLDPGQPVDLHPHAQSIAKLNRQLERGDITLEERETVEAKLSQHLKDGDPLAPDLITRYMQILGAVQYLATVTRPDIAHATGRLARFMSNPTKYLLKCAERVLRYLFTTVNFGLVLDGGKDLTLPAVSGFADSNYIPNSHSTTGLVLCLFGQPVHWRSKRQNILAGSSTEAEIMAMNKGALELKWIKMLVMNDLGIDATNTVLYGDNTSCISVCKDPQSSDRTRHIDGRYKKIQEMVKNKVLSVKWISTKSMLADILTKQLCAAEFIKARSELGVLKIED